MKAVCVKGFIWKGSPKVGETVLIVKTYLEKHEGKNYYYHILDGYWDWCGWRVEHFSIQITDEMELLKERQQTLTPHLIK